MTETLNPNHCWLQLEKLDPLSCLLTWVGIPMATQCKQKLKYGIYLRFLEHMSPDCSVLKNAFFLLVFMMPCFSNFSPSCLITTSQTLLLAFRPPPGVYPWLSLFTHFAQTISTTPTTWRTFLRLPNPYLSVEGACTSIFWHIWILELFMSWEVLENGLVISSVRTVCFVGQQ